MRTLLRRSILPVLAAVLPAMANAQARGTTVGSVDFIGSRSESQGGVFPIGPAFNGSDDNFTISWVISPLSGGLWSYQYTLSNYGGQAQNISHLIIALSGNCATSNTASDGTCVQNPTVTKGAVSGTPTGGIGTWSSAMGNSNNGMPNPIFGVKMNRPSAVDGGSGIVFSFTSERVPVWGDFYVRGGGDNYAFNTGLTTANFNSNNTAFYIARPDGVSTVTPEPASMLLMGTGIGALGLVGYRRRKA